MASAAAVVLLLTMMADFCTVVGGGVLSTNQYDRRKCLWQVVWYNLNDGQWINLDVWKISTKVTAAAAATPKGVNELNVKKDKDKKTNKCHFQAWLDAIAPNVDVSLCFSLIMMLNIEQIWHFHGFMNRTKLIFNAAFPPITSNLHSLITLSFVYSSTVRCNIYICICV